MANPNFEKKQRLILRSLKDIDVQASKALIEKRNTELQILAERTNGLIAYFQKNIVAPEILAYISQIPPVTHGETEPSLLRIMSMNIFSLFSGRHAIASSRDLKRCQEVQDHFNNLRMLVEMMDPE